MFEIAICDDNVNDLHNTEKILQGFLSEQKIDCNVRGFYYVIDQEHKVFAKMNCYESV